MASVLALQAPGEPGGHLLEGAILQEAREEKVSGLEQRDGLGIHQLTLRQEPCHLHVEQRRRDHQELRSLVEFLVVVELLEVRDELVRDCAQGDLGDVHLVLRDEVQQQIERAVEVRQ